MSKVFYHWGLEERVRKFCLKSNMTTFTRCKSWHIILPNRSLGVQTHHLQLFWFSLPTNHRIADRSSHHFHSRIWRGSGRTRLG